MKRSFWLCSAVLAALLGAVADSHQTRVPDGTLWVTERTPANSTVAAIDAATGEPRGITAVGAAPIGITAPRGLDKVYSADENAHQLSVIDKESVTVLTTIPMGPGSRPHHLMASVNGRYIYVAEYGTNTVGVVDTQLDLNIVDLTASFNPAGKTHAVWIAPNGIDLFAVNQGFPTAGPGTLSKLNTKTGEIVWEAAVGNQPSEVLVDRTTAYVSIRNEHAIRVYDVSGDAPLFLGEAEAEPLPDTLSLTNDKRTVIVGLRGTPARMAFIDTATLTTTYLLLPGATTGHQWLSSNSRFTFIALESPGRIAVVDNRTRTLVTTYAYPNGMPRLHGVFYEPPRGENRNNP